MEQFKLNWTGAEVNDAISRINNLFDLIYPVGSIYMSVNNTSPATLFGGTWVQIKDTFLLACGDTYANAATGGSATHAHTEGDLRAAIGASANSPDSISYAAANPSSRGPSTVGAYSLYGMSYTTNSRNFNHYTSVYGTTAAASNLPPYLAVYVWKRTA